MNKGILIEIIIYLETLICIGIVFLLSLLGVKI